MGGFQFNGCGARDYFKKVKYLGDQMCPKCKKITPFYLEKGKFKISVLWVPTVTIKERYAIMCENCKEGRWIEDVEAYKILSGDTYTTNETAQYVTKSSFNKCPQCGAEMDGPFCGICGTKYTSAEITSDVVEEQQKRICSNCGAEVEGAFCGICGAKYTSAEITSDVVEEQQKRICSNCGAEVEGAFCGICGTKYTSAETASDAAEEQQKRICSNCGAEVDGNFCSNCGTRFIDNLDSPKGGEEPNENVSPQEWECSLCGTYNPASSNKCSLCGCEKDK